MHRLATAVRRLLRAVGDQYRSLGQLRDRDVLLLAVANCLGTTSVSIVVPLLPTYAESHGAGPLLIGAIFAAPAATRATLSLPAGYASDLLGRRRLIVGGAVLDGASVLALAVAPSPAAILALRALDGVGMAATGPATTAYLGDAVPEPERGRAMGAYQAAGTLGIAVGPAVGGALALAAGPAAPFAVLGAATLAGGFALAAYLRPIAERPQSASGGTDGAVAADPAPEDDTERADASEDGTERAGRSVDGAERAGSSVRGWRDRLPSPTRADAAPFLSLSVVALGASVFVSQLATGATNPLLAPLLDTRFGGGPGYASLAWTCFGLGMVACTPVGGSVADRFGRKRPLVASKVAWVGVVAGLLLLDSPVAPPLLLFVGGAASGIGAPAMGALQYELAPEGREGTLGGVYSALSSGAQAVGPLLGGALAAVAGVVAVFVATASVWALDTLTIALGVRAEDARGSSGEDTVARTDDDATTDGVADATPEATVDAAGEAAGHGSTETTADASRDE